MKVIVPPNYNIPFDKLLFFKKDNRKMLTKLKELVKKKKTFEEESMLYNYKGKDKDLIWSCMEFFYKNLYTKEFQEFIWHDDKDDWENYHILIRHEDRLSEVTIVYGIGSFCVIAPFNMKTKVPLTVKVLNLDKIVIGNLSISYED